MKTIHSHLTVLLATIIASVASGAEPTAPRLFYIGVGTHFAPRSEGDQVAADAGLGMIAEAGIQSVRDEIYWCDLETERGRLTMPAKYDLFVKNTVGKGIEPLVILGYGNTLYGKCPYPESDETVEAFTRYAEFVVSHFKGKVKLYQLWNEYDGGCGMPPEYQGKSKPEFYVKLLRSVYPRVKAIDPSVTFICGSPSYTKWLEQIAKLGCLKSVDLMDHHPYNFGSFLYWRPVITGDLRKDRLPEAWYARMIRDQDILCEYSGGKEVPMVITEMGWPNQIDKYGTRPEETAAFLARTYLLGRTLPFLKGMWWYTFTNNGWNWKDAEDNYGLVQADLTPKPAYYVLRDIVPLLKSKLPPKRIETEDPDFWALKFTLDSGREALVMWSAHVDSQVQAVLQSDAPRPSPVQVRPVGHGSVTRSWGARASNQLEITVGELPWVVEGDLSQVRIVQINKKDYPRDEWPAIKKEVPIPAADGFAYPLNGNRPEPEVHIGRDIQWVSLLQKEKWSGPSDLSAILSFAYSPDSLKVTVVVADDRHVQNEKMDTLWKGDSVQIALQASGEGQNSRFTTFTMALADDGPKLYRKRTSSNTAPGLITNLPFTITQSGDTLTYTATLPVATCGLPKLEPGTIVGVSIRVNDNDGQGRKGFLQWGSGVGLNKDPRKSNRLVCLPCPQ